MFGVTKESAYSGIPVFQKVNETAQGGFTLDDTGLVAGTIIPAGSVIGFDESTRKAKVLKGGVLYASATNVATTYQIQKGNNLAVGMTPNLAGGTARAVTVIDRSNANYDLITVATTIGVAAAAGVDIAVGDDGQSKAAGLLFNEVTVGAAGQTKTLSVVIDGTVYERRIPPVSAIVKARMVKVLFSQSY